MRSRRFLPVVFLQNLKLIANEAFAKRQEMRGDKDFAEDPSLFRSEEHKAATDKTFCGASDR